MEASPAPTDAPEKTDAPKKPKRRVSVIAILVVATLIGFLAIFAVWAKRQLLETDTYANTSSQLLENSNIRTAVGTFLVNELYANVDVEAKLAKALPPQAQPLAGPVAGGLQQVAFKAADEALQSSQVQDLWKQANLKAHAELVNLIEGGGPVLSTTNGDVTLDLGQLVTQLGDQVGVNVAGKIPPDVGQINIVSSDQITTAQDAVNALQALALVLPLLTLALYGLAIYLAKGRRRRDAADRRLLLHLHRRPVLRRAPRRRQRRVDSLATRRRQPAAQARGTSSPPSSRFGGGDDRLWGRHPVRGLARRSGVDRGHRPPRDHAGAARRGVAYVVLAAFVSWCSGGLPPPRCSASFRRWSCSRC